MISYFARFAMLLVVLPVLLACSSPVEDGFNAPGAGMARLGRHMQEKGDTGAAIDFYRRALRANPSHLAAIEGLSSILSEWGDKEGAVKVYQGGVEAWPEKADLRYAFGKLLITMDRPAEAVTQFEAALDVNDEDARARVGLGIALDYLGEHKKAQDEYEQALKDDPTNLSISSNLAYSYILTHRYDRAIKLLEPLYNKASATAALRQNLALAYGLSGMDADAKRIGLMDLTEEKVDENMKYYRLKRAELSLGGAPYAELGTYATEAMAIAQINRLKKSGKVRGDLRPIILPEVSAPGGTPRFAVRMMGCSRPNDVSRLCKTLAASGIPCVPRGKGAAME